MPINRDISRYDELGYFVIDGAVDESDIASLKGAAAGIVEKFDVANHRSVFSTRHRDRDRDQYFIDSAEAVHCFLEEDAVDEDGDLVQPKDRAINKIGHAMHSLVPEFAAFCRLPVFVDALNGVGFEQPQLWQSMYIYKQPRIGGVVNWHQDASYLIADAPGVVGMWIALEDADRSNGCLWVEPGGHRSPLRQIFETSTAAPYGELRDLDNTPWPGESDGVALEVSAGTAVIFSDHMPHYSSHNHSDRSRQAFTMHFTDGHSGWSERNWLQRKTLAPFVLGN